MSDAIVIGAGPNGLVAACHLARAGWSVTVIEGSEHAGGACRSSELTLPGFVHDMGAAFFPFGGCSKALLELELEEVGLRWCRGEIESAHPALDGTCASIAATIDESERCFGGLPEDGRAFGELARWHARTREAMLDTLLGPLPPLRPALRFGPVNLAVLAEVGLSSGRAFARRFRAEAAKRVLPALALHTDVGPDDACGAAVGFMLGMLASSNGFRVPEGGTSAITNALLHRLEEAGGEVVLGERVNRIVTKGGRAVAVETHRGERDAKRAIIADTAAPTLYLELLDDTLVPSRVRRAMQRFPFGFGTFKVDWALSAEVPWKHPDAARAAVVHTGESLDDLSAFTTEVRRGQMPRHPYLVIGQQSLLDPTRAPDGQHTLWAYSRVPASLDWTVDAERYADRIDDRIEALAPGFKSRILARSIHTPAALAHMDENLIDGDLGGGSAQIQHQLFMRPVFPYYRYRTPVEGLYLGSSYTHPGAGVHGACGYNAAQAALADAG